MTNFRTTAKKYTDDLEALCWSDTFYKNSFPYNCLYCYGNDRFSADCNNLIKALVNGREIKNAKAGSYQPTSDMPLTGDCTEWKLLNLCKNVSTDFNKLGSYPHVLYMDGHVGTYLGYEVEYYGNTYNTVECTAWTGDVGHDGVIYSYVDKGGNRRTHKGGTINKMWSRHGDMSTLVDCSVLSDKVKNTTDPVGNRVLTYQENWMCEQFMNDERHYIAVGRNNLYLDVVFVQSFLQWYGYYNGLVDGDYGEMSKQAAIKWQTKVGLYPDGEIGPKSWNMIRINKGE